VNVAILGSGFGLYGYLPAIAECCHEHVILPERYRAQLKRRADVAIFENRIQWLANESAALENADAAILAVRPDDQISYVDGCLGHVNIKRILLEKPLAPTPQQAADLLDRIVSRGRIIRIGYTFRYTAWAQSLIRAIGSLPIDEPIEINWLFQAHHYKTNARNWKRSVAAGGGVVRFFGIHLIALLAEMGYTTVLESEVSAAEADQAEIWRATFAGLELPRMRVVVHSNSVARAFRVRSREMLHQSNDPFENANSVREFDPRVGGLTLLCREFLYDDRGSLPWYRASIELWRQVEDVSKRISFG
jgi:predicted dehydrogenase